MTAPIDLYFWPTPNGWKITIALEEMGLEYNLKPINIGAGEQFTPEFLAISPNNRMPALVDHDGLDGQPISVFESGAILQYLARKTGQFYGTSERDRVEIESWLMWQMGGLGPMGGQANHFRNYAPRMEPDESKIAYGQVRYTDEVHRLYGVLDKRLGDRDYVAGPYSIADMAIWPWVLPDAHGQDLKEFPHLAAWRDRVKARPAFKAGISVGKDLRMSLGNNTEEMKKARDVLFGQRARS